MSHRFRRSSAAAKTRIKAREQTRKSPTQTPAHDAVRADRAPGKPLRATPFAASQAHVHRPKRRSTTTDSTYTYPQLAAPTAAFLPWSIFNRHRWSIFGRPGQPQGFKRIRHYGLLAPAHKSERLAKARAALNAVAPNPVAMESARAFMSRVAKIDILRCPACGQGTLQVVLIVLPTTAPRADPIAPARGPP